MTAVLVSRVRRVAGDDGVAQLLEKAASSRTAGYLEDIGNWISYDEAIALWEAGIEVTGDPEFPRHIGEDTVRLLGASANATVLRALGSPEKLLEHISESSHRFSTVAELEAASVAPGSAEILARAAPGFERHRHQCEWTAGLLTLTTPLFGLAPAEVRHEECQVNGDSVCRYFVTWATEPASESDPDELITSLQKQLDAMSGRLQSIFDTASDLISSGDLDQTLARITGRAALQVRAPRYLLVVRPTPSSVQWHQRGLDEEECREIAHRVLANEESDFPENWLVVPVQSHRTNYGSLVAMHQEGHSFFAQERQILEVYARYAATALDSAASLSEAKARQEEAQRRYEESRVLLELARNLSRAASSEEIAQRLAEAIPVVVDCDRVGVYLWNELDGELVRHAVGGVSAANDAEGLQRIHPSDVPELAQLRDHPDPEPLLVNLAETQLLERLRPLGVIGTVAVPIAARQRLLGALVVSVTDRPARLDLTPELRDRLSGVAAHAVTALENGRLVDHITHQASHDQLTGLVNRTGFSEVLDRAFAVARETESALGIFYVDLDDFKRINDEHGHDVGDEVLRAVADRLVDRVRPNDTVARLGGDEFVILVPEIDEAAQIETLARRLEQAFEEPFQACNRSFSLGASIGRAVWPLEVGELEALLHQADTSMYEVKRGKQRPLAGGVSD